MCVPMCEYTHTHKGALQSLAVAGEVRVFSVGLKAAAGVKSSDRLSAQ